MKNIRYDAAEIEHSLALFFGMPVNAPGRPWDESIFRHGDARRIAAVLDLVVDRLEQRSARIAWTPEDLKPRGAWRTLRSSGAGLRAHAEALRRSGVATPDDPEWELLGLMIGVTDSLLRKLGV